MNNKFMTNNIARIKDALGYGSKYYDGPLISYFDSLFKDLEKDLISPELAKSKVKNFFKSNSELKDFFLEQYGNEKKNFEIIGSKLRPLHRIRLGIFYLDVDTFEPIHCHKGFTSFQIILSGKCVLNEFDKILKSDDKVQYKSYTSQVIDTDDVMLNYSQYRDIHGFGAINEPVRILTIGKYYGLFGKMNLNWLSQGINNREYLDINEQISIGNNINECPLIGEQEAYKKYKKTSTNT